MRCYIKSIGNFKKSGKCRHPLTALNFAVMCAVKSGKATNNVL